MSDETRILDKPKMQRIEGWVYCHQLGEVHEDSLNPYGMGPESHCRRDEHRPLYYRARRGDYAE